MDESQFGVYSNFKMTFNKWIIIPGVRLDMHNFSYVDQLQTDYQNNTSFLYTVNPKLITMYNLNRNIQLFAKAGSGYHTNDSRAVADNPSNIPRAKGFDVGFFWKLHSSMILQTTYWYLHSEDELVYVGDAGIVENVGPTKRNGIDLSTRYEMVSGLFLNLDLNWAVPKLIGETPGFDHVPLAPVFTWMFGIQYRYKIKI